MRLQVLAVADPKVRTVSLGGEAAPLSVPLPSLSLFSVSSLPGHHRTRCTASVFEEEDAVALARVLQEKEHIQELVMARPFAGVLHFSFS